MKFDPQKLIAFENNFSLPIAGIDEVGRGPLAGPVVAAAVIFSSSIDIPGLDDSKKLSAKKRNNLLPKIQESAVAYGIAVVGPKVIDEINILQAARLAMKRAVDELQLIPDLLLIDGNQKIESTIDQWAIIKGDSKSLSIAAASILAKVSRDRAIMRLGKNHDIGSGYPSDPKTKMFVKKSLRRNRDMPFLRKSWKPVQILMKKRKFFI